MPGKAHAVEMYSGETFHRGTTLFGIACSPSSIETLVTTLRDHRPEVSIDKRFFDSERIRKDMRDMVAEDLNNILSRELDHGETRLYLIDRLGTHLMDHMGLVGDVREDTKRLVASARDNVISKEETLESERAGEAAVKDLDLAERLYPKKTTLPKTESFGRRKSFFKL